MESKLAPTESERETTFFVYNWSLLRFKSQEPQWSMSTNGIRMKIIFQQVKQKQQKEHSLFGNLSLLNYF